MYSGALPSCNSCSIFTVTHIPIVACHNKARQCCYLAVSFPHLIKNCGLQLGFVTHLLTFLRIIGVYIDWKLTIYCRQRQFPQYSTRFLVEMSEITETIVSFSFHGVTINLVTELANNFVDSNTAIVHSRNIPYRSLVLLLVIFIV